MINQSIDYLTNEALIPGISNIELEAQNADYEGFCFEADGVSYRSRFAKKTPKKNGYFVVFWEKNESNTNQAYAYETSPAFLIIIVKDKHQCGYFKIPKDVLFKQGILRSQEKAGKMGIRIYPAWEKELNSSAQKTQKWQAPYFKQTSI
ncbi:MepB family protein [Erysipelothrix aquatica]|uniref:MepB family protein n=1 Tax=Erysipelothrix aquatica TaxID=2683714 RepID=UPI00135C7375|nr:MepB family protein [Erysipelothrix aquatica]